MDQDTDAGTKLLRSALLEEDLDKLRLAASQVSNLNELVLDGFAPLSCAAQMDSLTFAQELIGSGACVNARNPDGSTALTWAHSVGMIELLLSSGALVSVETPNFGNTSVHRAALKGRVDLLELLLGKGDGRVALPLIDGAGRTPLSCAATSSEAALACLVSAGADPNQVAGEYPTPLQWALDSNNLNGAEYLLRSGADVDLTTGLNPSPRQTILHDDRLLALRRYVEH